MSRFPRSWASVTLADVTSQRSIKIDPSKIPETPFIGLEEVEAHTGRILRYASTANLKSAVAIFEKGDVLYGRLRPYLNKVVLAEICGAASAEFIILPPSDIIDQQFLQHVLMSPDFVSFTGLKSTGDRPRVNFEAISGYELNLPPLAEQRRIVAKIDSLTAKSKRAREHLDHIPRLVEKYKQAILAAAFRGEFAKEETSELTSKPFSSVVESTFYGPRISNAAYVQEGVPTLRTTDIGDWGELVLKAPPQVAITDEEYKRWGFQNGDLMITRTGATIGKCALYDSSLGKALPSAYLIRVRLKREIVNSKYALYFLLSPLGQVQLLDGVTAVAVPNVNAQAIGKALIPLPSLSAQAQTVSVIQDKFAWIDRIFLEASRSAALVDHLDQAILAKAFRGQLVPQDPKDEPASVLLERIRAAREASEAGKAGRRKATRATAAKKAATEPA
ncbi:restriction endonuclease subunit S [Rhodomicrobium lacus]|uniref:restriction endonuclease subunit S n=1 Tax=Rhodomicrobium lacus TaxID=2498452 RepID=UPI0026E36181|nr:restriction endonuclease subunit S [Rhodomicrobium lacus]WKW50724.1 restriction endonuclease subunit S [Rhodomicrobium lacus]